MSIFAAFRLAEYRTLRREMRAEREHEKWLTGRAVCVGCGDWTGHNDPDANEEEQTCGRCVRREDRSWKAAESDHPNVRG